MEEWRQILDHPQYDVSNMGNIRNRNTNRILEQSVNKTGKCTVRLDNQTEIVSRLVAREFVPGKGILRNQVIHRDGDRTNNKYYNLEWITQSELRKRSYGCDLPYSHKQAHKVLVMETGEEFWSIADCARRLGVNPNRLYYLFQKYVSVELNGYHLIRLRALTEEEELYLAQN